MNKVLIITQRCRSRLKVLFQLFALASFLQNTVYFCCFALKLPLVLIQIDIRQFLILKMSYIFPWENMTRKVKITNINISIKYIVVEKNENILSIKYTVTSQKQQISSVALLNYQDALVSKTASAG